VGEHTTQSDDLVVLNHHVPNCDCQVSDEGRVALSETCAGWTAIMRRFIADGKNQARAEAVAAVRMELREERRSDPSTYDVWSRVSSAVDRAAVAEGKEAGRG
jgi:hypothetical protein